MVGQISHSFSATQGEALSNSAGVATTWVGPNEWNSVHSLNATLTGSTAGVSTVSGTNIILGASQNLTVSGTSNTIWFQGPQLSNWSPFISTVGAAATSTSLSSAFGGCLVSLPVEVAATRLNVLMNQTINIWGGTTAASTAGGSTSSTTFVTKFCMGLYSRQGGTSTGTLTAVSTWTWNVTDSLSMSVSSSSISASRSMIFPFGIPASTVTVTMSGTTNSTSISRLTVGASANFVAAGILPLPLATTLAPGEYFFGAPGGPVTLGGAAEAAFGIQALGMNLPVNKYLGVTTGSTAPPNDLYQPIVLTTAASFAAAPSSIAISNLTTTNNFNSVPWFDVMNYLTGASIL